MSPSSCRSLLIWETLMGTRKFCAVINFRWQNTSHQRQGIFIPCFSLVIYVINYSVTWLQLGAAYTKLPSMQDIIKLKGKSAPLMSTWNALTGFEVVLDSKITRKKMTLSQQQIFVTLTIVLRSYADYNRICCNSSHFLSPLLIYCHHYNFFQYLLPIKIVVEKL